MTVLTLILLLFVLLVYGYFIKAFRYATDGVNYLTYLFNNPKKLDTPKLMDILKTRDIPSIKIFIAERSRLRSIIITTYIVNVIVFVFYPYDTLLYPWMGYILTAALIIQNINTYRVFTYLRKNKLRIGLMCATYYDLEEEQEYLKKQVSLIELSFADLVEKINSAMKEEEYTDGDEGGDEK